MNSVHIQLKNSPGHFKNSVNKESTRVGFGIVPVNGNTALYLTVMLSTRDFSKYPLTSQETSTFKTQVTNDIVAGSPHITGESSKLSADLDEWVHGDRSVGLFTHMFSKGNYFAMSYRSYTAPYSDGLADKLRDQKQFMTSSSSFSKIGVSLKTDNSGNLITYVIYGQ